MKRKERKDEKNEIRKPAADEKTDLNSKKRRKREEGREEKKRRRKERNEKVNLPNGPIGKKIWENSEQLERSGLTEEHDQPIRLHLPSTSSESTEYSSTRKRQTSHVNVIRGHGNFSPPLQNFSCPCQVIIFVGHTLILYFMNVKQVRSSGYSCHQRSRTCLIFP